MGNIIASNSNINSNELSSNRKKPKIFEEKENRAPVTLF